MVRAEYLEHSRSEKRHVIIGVVTRMECPSFVVETQVPDPAVHVFDPDSNHTLLGITSMAKDDFNTMYHSYYRGVGRPAPLEHDMLKDPGVAYAVLCLGLRRIGYYVQSWPHETELPALDLPTIFETVNRRPLKFVIEFDSTVPFPKDGAEEEKLRVTTCRELCAATGLALSKIHINRFIQKCVQGSLTLDVNGVDEGDIQPTPPPPEPEGPDHDRAQAQDAQSASQQTPPLSQPRLPNADTDDKNAILQKIERAIKSGQLPRVKYFLPVLEAVCVDPQHFVIGEDSGRVLRDYCGEEGSREGLHRGDKQYHPPRGWYRFPLRVDHIDGVQHWLHDNAWEVAYHGVANHSNNPNQRKNVPSSVHSIVSSDLLFDKNQVDLFYQEAKLARLGVSRTSMCLRCT